MWAAAEGHADVVKALLDAKADPNRKARVTTLDERKHADHPTGGFTALMYAVRNGHEAVARALAAGGADPNLTNGDGVTALIVAIVNDRFDLAGTLVDLGADANDGSLYFAVDMHDATTDMRARDGSRLRADHPNTMTALDLIAKLLDRGADPNKAFTGQLHSSTLCCSDEINASPFYRAAVAADVEALKLMIAHGADVEWSPKPVKKTGSDEDQRRRTRQRQRRPNAGHRGDQRRARRGVRGRSRIRAARAAAVPRSVESRAGRGGQGAARGRSESERQDAGRLDAAASGGRRRVRCRSFARSWRQAPSSTPSTRTT